MKPYLTLFLHNRVLQNVFLITDSRVSKFRFRNFSRTRRPLRPSQMLQKQTQPRPLQAPGGRGGRSAFSLVLTACVRAPRTPADAPVSGERAQVSVNIYITEVLVVEQGILHRDVTGESTRMRFHLAVNTGRGGSAEQACRCGSARLP